jgi:hypothetical protein
VPCGPGGGGGRRGSRPRAPAPMVRRVGRSIAASAAFSRGFGPPRDLGGAATRLLALAAAANLMPKGSQRGAPTSTKSSMLLYPRTTLFSLAAILLF